MHGYNETKGILVYLTNHVNVNSPYVFTCTINDKLGPYLIIHCINCFERENKIRECHIEVSIHLIFLTIIGGFDLIKLFSPINILLLLQVLTTIYGTVIPQTLSKSSTILPTGRNNRLTL